MRKFLQAPVLHPDSAQRIFADALGKYDEHVREAFGTLTGKRTNAQ